MHAAVARQEATLLTEAEWSRLIEALIQVESGGKNFAVGDGGKAIGCLQIHQAVVDDYNLYNTRIVYQEVLRREVAVKVCRWYLQFYGGRFWRKHGHDETRTKQEILARIWNGGPTGMSKIATISYWHKVRNLL